MVGQACGNSSFVLTNAGAAAYLVLTDKVLTQHYYYIGLSENNSFYVSLCSFPVNEKSTVTLFD